MKIISKKISELIPYVNNARIHSESQVLKIASSIKEFGFLVPVLIKKDGEIICGHGRILAAQKLKIEQVPCIIAENLTDAQVKAFRIAENKLTEDAKWDYEMLAIEFQELKDINFEIDLTGFPVDEINAMLNIQNSAKINEKEFSEDSFKETEIIKKFILFVPDSNVDFEYKLNEFLKQFENVKIEKKI